MQSLDKFDPQTAGKYDPGQIIVLYDNRTYKSHEDKLGFFQSYWLEGMYNLGWPSLSTPNLEPGYIRLIFYTVCSNTET